MSNFKIGDRVRSTVDYSPNWPIGITGVVIGKDTAGGYKVALDRGDTTTFSEHTLELYTSVIGNHYQPVIASETDYDHDYTQAPKDTALSGDELMDITRSFCR